MKAESRKAGTNSGFRDVRNNAAFCDGDCFLQVDVAQKVVRQLYPAIRRGGRSKSNPETRMPAFLQRERGQALRATEGGIKRGGMCLLTLFAASDLRFRLHCLYLRPRDWEKHSLYLRLRRLDFVGDNQDLECIYSQYLRFRTYVLRSTDFGCRWRFGG